MRTQHYISMDRIERLRYAAAEIFGEQITLVKRHLLLNQRDIYSRSSLAAILQ